MRSPRRNRPDDLAARIAAAQRGMFDDEGTTKKDELLDNT